MLQRHVKWEREQETDFEDESRGFHLLAWRTGLVSRILEESMGCATIVCQTP